MARTIEINRKILEILRNSKFNKKKYCYQTQTEIPTKRPKLSMEKVEAEIDEPVFDERGGIEIVKEQLMSSGKNATESSTANILETKGAIDITAGEMNNTQKTFNRSKTAQQNAEGDVPQICNGQLVSRGETLCTQMVNQPTAQQNAEADVQPNHTDFLDENDDHIFVNVKFENMESLDNTEKTHLQTQPSDECFLDDDDHQFVNTECKKLKPIFRQLHSKMTSYFWMNKSCNKYWVKLLKRKQRRLPFTHIVTFHILRLLIHRI